jgi:hypothetical protein
VADISINAAWGGVQKGKTTTSQRHLAAHGPCDERWKETMVVFTLQNRYFLMFWVGRLKEAVQSRCVHRQPTVRVDSLSARGVK